MKTLSTAAFVAVLVLGACGRNEQESRATANASVPAASAKPELVPVAQRRVVELGGGIRVEVLAEGQGAIVAPGDHVALSMTLSYVPVAPSAATAPVPSGDEKGDGKQDESTAAEVEKSAEPAVAVEGIVVLDAVVAAVVSAEPSKPEPAPVEVPDTAQPADPTGTIPAAPSGAEPAASTSTKPAAPTGTVPAAPTGTVPAAPTGTVPAAPTITAPATPASTEPAATEGTPSTPESPSAPAEPPLAAPLEPVVLMSTKSTGTPLRVVVGSSGALLPPGSRALVGLRQGTIVEITLAPEAAYGAAGLPSAGVPPGTPLFATVEIREVKR